MNHINGIYFFWCFCKRRMVRQNAVRKDRFLLHLKVSEFKWNYSNDMCKVFLDDLKELIHCHSKSYSSLIIFVI